MKLAKVKGQRTINAYCRKCEKKDIATLSPADNHSYRCNACDSVVGLEIYLYCNICEQVERHTYEAIAICSGCGTSADMYTINIFDQHSGKTVTSGNLFYLLDAGTNCSAYVKIMRDEHDSIIMSDVYQITQPDTIATGIKESVYNYHNDMPYMPKFNDYYKHISVTICDMENTFEPLTGLMTVFTLPYYRPIYHNLAAFLKVKQLCEVRRICHESVDYSTATNAAYEMIEILEGMGEDDLLIEAIDSWVNAAIDWSCENIMLDTHYANFALDNDNSLILLDLVHVHEN